MKRNCYSRVCVYIYIYMSHIGRMENEMETAIIGIYIYVYELYWDNGKGNGNCYSRAYIYTWVLLEEMESKMETAI